MSSVSDYCFYKARVAEEGVWFEQEPREMYKVGNTYYAKAKRGRVRGSQRGWPSRALVFEGSLRRFEWQPDDDAAEDVYVTMPEAFGERSRGWPLGHAGDEGPHLRDDGGRHGVVLEWRHQGAVSLEVRRRGQ